MCDAKEISQCFSKPRLAVNSLRLFDFDNPSHMDDNGYMVKTGLNKGNNIALFFFF